VRVKDALDAHRPYRRQSGFGAARRQRGDLIAAALVLGGALAAGQRFRIYDAVVLRTLGATRLRLLAAYALNIFSSVLPRCCSA
jgi:putative ABC transport system permease protein